MIPDEVARQAAAKRNDQESGLATTLLESGRPSWADAWCDRHNRRLARVYNLPGERTVLAVRESRHLRGALYDDVSPDDTREAVEVAWAYDLNDPEQINDASIYMRCRQCGLWSTSTASVRDQLDRMKPGDRRRILISKAARAGDPKVKRLKEFLDSDDTPER